MLSHFNIKIEFTDYRPALGSFLDLSNIDWFAVSKDKIGIVLASNCKYWHIDDLLTDYEIFRSENKLVN